VHQLVNKKNFNNIKMHGMYVKIMEAKQARLCNSYKSLLPNSATYTHQQGPTNIYAASSPHTDVF